MMRCRVRLLATLASLAGLPSAASASPVARPHAAPPQNPSLTPAEDRITDLIRAWYFARLFHPDLAGSEAEWNAALVAAVEPSLAAPDDAAFAAVVDTMLGKAGGSRASIVAATPPAPAAAAGMPTFRLVDGVAVADCAAIGTARMASTSLADAVAAVRPAIEQKGMVVDCRNFAARGEQRYFQTLHSVEWARSLISSATPVPVAAGFRQVRFHDGYPPETGNTSGGYEAGLASIAITPLTGRPGAVKPRLTFLFDATTPPEALPVAAAAQSAGLARVVIEGSGTTPERTVLALRHVRAEILTARYIAPDGRGGLRPDACVAEGDAATGLSTAIALLDPAKAGGGCAAPAARPAPQAPAVAAAPAPFALPSVGERVLALAKLWGGLTYFNPYRSLLDHSWEEQLDAFVPVFLKAATRAEYETALRRLTHESDDSHVGVRGLSTDAGRFSPPLYIRPVGKGWAVAAIHNPAGAPGVAVGDELVSVDGRPVADLFAEARALTAASTPQSAMGILSGHLIAGPKDSVARLGLRRGDRPFEVSLPRSLEFWTARSEPADKSPAWRRLAGDIGYIDLQRLGRADADKAMDDLLDTKALVFDLRGYPQGTAWIIAPRLAPDDAPRVAALFRRPQYRGPGQPTALFSSFAQELPQTEKPRYKGRVVVMIDDRAISQSEHTALFFKAARPDAIFVGSPTTGANGDVTTINLPGNLVVSFTGHSVRFPDGRELQRQGIQPDIAVAPTLAGMRAGRDEVLEAALKAAQARKR